MDLQIVTTIIDLPHQYNMENAFHRQEKLKNKLYVTLKKCGCMKFRIGILFIGIAIVGSIGVTILIFNPQTVSAISLFDYKSIIKLIALSTNRRQQFFIINSM